MPVTQTEVTPQWATYIDLKNDVKPYLEFSNPTGLNPADTMLQMVTDMACTWVQNYLGRPVADTEFFRRFSGWSGMNGAYVSLPYYPVTQIVSVVEYWGSSGPHTLTEQTPASQGGQDVYQVDYLRGTVIRTFMGLVQRPWFPGSRNIEITWKAGYEPVPADIKMATLELVNYWWRNTQEATRVSSLEAVEYEAPAASGMWAAVPNRVKVLLEPYAQQGIG